MSGESGGNEEFLEQLRLQQLYGQSREAGNGDDPYTFVDPEDGTVYDWDQEKKAWFPKKESVALAERLIDDSEIRGYRLHVEAARFELKGEYDASKKRKKAKDYRKKLQRQQKYAPHRQRAAVPAVHAHAYTVDIEPITEDFLAAYHANYGFNEEGTGKPSVSEAPAADPVAQKSAPQKPQAEGAEVTQPKEGKQKEKRKADPGEETGSLISRVCRPGDGARLLTFLLWPLSEHTQEDPLVLNEIREDLRTECEKFGQVKKVIIFDRHPDGVASVAFKEPEEADVCQLALDGRWFGGRKLSVQHWDGTTDYQVEETNREREERLKGWASFLGEKDSGKAGGEALKDSAGQAEKGAPQDPKSSTEEPPSKLEGPGTEHPEPGGAKEEAEGSGAGVSEEAVADSTDSSLAGSEEEEESEEA
nr:PREDICTED: HIV Tat-specific factor 1 [Lepisosteus oculatus]